MLTNLQYLRGIAALLVVVGHTLQLLSDRVWHVENPVLRLFMNSGASGVDVFFVISGFIMFHVSRRSAGGPADARRFLLRRMVRVYPLYWIITTVVVLFFVSGIPNSKADLSPDYLILGTLLVPVQDLDGVLGPVLTVGWTLMFEMFFYLCFALALFLPVRMRAAALTVGMVGLVLLGVVLPSLRESSIVFHTYTSTLLIEFLFGVWIAMAFHSSARLPRWVCAALVVAGFGALLGLFGDDDVRWLVSGIPAAAIVLGAVMLHKAATTSDRVIASLKHLGDASYSLYLGHPVMLFVVSFATRYFTDGGPLVFAIVLVGALAAQIVAALVLYRMVERPLTDYLNNRLPGRRHDPTPGQVPSR